MNKDFITLEESKDQLIGKVGTTERDAYEKESFFAVINKSGQN